MKFLLKWLDEPERWDSLIINRRKPHTIRLFTFNSTKDARVCLHKFFPCSSDEAFPHPHPWPAVFTILENGYHMKIGVSKDRFSEPEYYENMYMRRCSSYEIDNPLTWHAIAPLNDEPVYTCMVNSAAFPDDVVHTAVRRTKGKDLEKLSENEKLDLLNKFKEILNEAYNI
jgi:hypothetical protein